ncbi:hypothetical protein VNO78_11325 [Psophocarpus tetragonolobus]|uniref:Uncharacterized protein n=1 Tax=Psophocarpus tetragonolobus TaxID=3891 RepID=A0AAN9SNR7_PSOTE
MAWGLRGILEKREFCGCVGCGIFVVLSLGIETWQPSHFGENGCASAPQEESKEVQEASERPQNFHQILPALWGSCQASADLRVWTPVLTAHDAQQGLCRDVQNVSTKINFLTLGLVPRIPLCNTKKIKEIVERVAELML